ncbi:MAG TPA: efflux RND transporter periplasmic adaptor subunit [Bacteroidia bacterium]|nr:efflux RND transporter periplasmic adaptor subunit [Bacteroidia bacterium]
MTRFTHIAVVALIAGGSIISSCKEKENKAASGSGGGGSRPPTSVNAVIAGTHDVSSTVNSSGTLLSNEEVEIRPELQARVIKVNFKEGSLVAKGQLLVKLDDAELVAQLKKLQAQKALNQKNLERLEELLKIEGVSRQEYDAVQTQVKAFDADIDLIKAQLRKTEIRAPFSGEIGLTNVVEGSYVTPLTLIATLQQTDPLKVDFAVPEKYAQLVKKGSKLYFTVDGFRDTFEATVYATESKIDLATRNIKVRARYPNRNGKLIPGMFARVSLGIENRQGAVMIPTQSLIPVARGKQVIVSKGGKAVFVSVEAGLRNEDQVEIIEGIQPGDTVITTGIMQLRPGALLRVSVGNKAGAAK